MKKLNLLFFIFLLNCIVLLLLPINLVKAKNEEYYAFSEVKFIEYKYHLKDYPKALEYGIANDNYLSKERTIKIPYYVLNIASPKFSKELAIKSLTINYQKHNLNKEGILENSSPDEITKELNLNKEEAFKSYKIDNIQRNQFLNGYKALTKEINLLYDARNYFLNLEYFTYPGIKKVILDDNQKATFKDSLLNAYDNHNNFLIKNKKCVLGNKPSSDLKDIFGDNNFYYQIFLGAAIDLENTGTYLSKFNVSNVEFTNNENNTNYDLNNINFIYNGYYEDGTLIKNEFIPQNENNDNNQKPQPTKKNTTLIVIITLVSSSLVIIAISLTLGIIIKRNHKKQEHNNKDY